MELHGVSRRNASLIVLILLLPPILFSSAFGQSKPHNGAPVIDIPENALRAGLLGTHLEMIEQNVKYWYGKMSDAATDDGVIAARKGLLADYRKYDSMPYQIAYAEKAVDILKPLLNSDDPRKQINVALAFSQMRQVTVQPALEIMVKHPNPAVRLYGWTGYQRIRMWVLAQGKGPIETMLNSLTIVAMKGDSGPVMSAIFRMLYLEPDRPSMVSKEDFDQTRLHLLNILEQAWPAQCNRVREEQLPMIRATSDALRTLRAISDSLGSDKEVQLSVVQMILDMMWQAAKTYSEAESNNPLFPACENLLRECESAMNFATKLRKTPIEEALAIKVAEDRKLNARIAVQSWIRELENAGYKIIEPKETESGETREPATAPASAPAAE